MKAEPTTSSVIKTEPVALKQGLVTIAELKEFVSKLGGTIPAVDLTKHYKNRLKVSLNTSVSYTMWWLHCSWTADMQREIA